MRQVLTVVHAEVSQAVTLLTSGPFRCTSMLNLMCGYRKHIIKFLRAMVPLACVNNVLKVSAITELLSYATNSTLSKKFPFGFVQDFPNSCMLSTLGASRTIRSPTLTIALQTSISSSRRTLRGSATDSLTSTATSAKCVLLLHLFSANPSAATARYYCLCRASQRFHRSCWAQLYAVVPTRIWFPFNNVRVKC